MSVPAQELDDEHLRLLRLGYFIAAGWNLFWALFPLAYVAMGVFMLVSPMAGGGASNQPDPRSFGGFLIAIGAAFSLLMAIVSVMKFLTARAIGRRRSRVLCMITAGITSLSLPYGTALGVATFLVLSRPTVQRQFEELSQ